MNEEQEFPHADDDEFLPVDLMVEFRLRQRDDPLYCLITVNVHPHWAASKTVHDLMEVAGEMVLSEIDTVGTHRLVFTDQRHNKHIIILSEIQAVSILAPDEMPRQEEE
jgi:hypothetical protein